MGRFVIGTRGSRLALRQTAIVRDALTAIHPGVHIDVLEIRTAGDVSKAPLSEIGGAGVFTGAIEEALLDGRIDIAVHSLKDLPPRDTDGLLLAAIPARADARDALVTRDGATLANLMAGARVGTGSARRAAQLQLLRPDLVPVDIRGNVDTRIRKVDAGEYDAAVLALAGLERLGLAGRAAQVFSPDEMVPAVGQGCLAVQVRAADRDARALAEPIDDPAARASAACERAFLARLGAGCRLPVGAYATVEGSTLRVRAMIAVRDTIAVEEAKGAAGDAARIGAALAEALIARAGAGVVSAEP